MNLAQWTLKKTAGMRLAHQAIMAQDAAQTLRSEREAVRAHHRRTHGEDFHDEGTPEVIHVGDIYQSTPGQPRSAGLGTLAKLGVAGALLASGGGLGAGLAAYFAQRPQTTDTDTRYELRLVPEAEK